MVPAQPLAHMLGASSQFSSVAQSWTERAARLASLSITNSRSLLTLPYLAALLLLISH